jgi:hypothetical protein
VSTLARWAAIVFAAWWIIHDPVSAGAAVHHLASFAIRAATSLATVVSSI